MMIRNYFPFNSYCKKFSKRKSKVDDTKISNDNLTPIEIVSGDMNLMRLIIQNVHSLKERKNLALVSRNFNNLCMTKYTYFPLIVNENTNNFEFNLKYNDTSLIYFSQNKLEIFIPYFNSRITKLLNSSKEVIKMIVYRCEELHIKGITHKYLDFFKSFESSNDLKLVRCDISNPYDLFILNFLYKLTGLNSKTIYLNILPNCNDMEEIIKNNKICFPETIRNIHLKCMPINFKDILVILKNSKDRKFLSLILKIETSKCGVYQNELCQMMSFFKEVKIVLNDEICRYTWNYFSNIFGRCNFLMETNIDIESNVCIKKFIRQNVSNINSMENNQFVPENNRNALIRTGYSYIKKLQIKYMSNTKFSLIRMHFLRNHLKEMINLTTLILDFNMINTLERFNQLCNSLNKDLKNLKMYNCLEMTIDYLLLLSNQCKQIEILSLNNIISETIQLRKVISTFGCLNGLYIDFGNFYNTMDILYALKHDGKDSYSLKWPEMNYLSIICNSLTPHEKILLDKIEKATPRKPGQFLINTISNTKNRNKRLKITIQKSLTYDGEFYKIFHDSFY